jgi:hypothetical protein
MIFLFPKKSIVLDCFTFDELALQTAPIAQAAKHLPEWWRKLPNTYLAANGFSVYPTMKTCVGMTDYYANSVAFPLWSALAIKVEKESYSWQFSDQITEVLPHDMRNQATGLLPNHGHIKITSIWKLKTKENINWIWSQPTYSFDESLSELKVLPGVFNFGLQRSTNINIVFPTDRERLYNVPHGQVLAHLTPMTDKKIKIKRHLISKQEFDLMWRQKITFTNTYRHIIKSKKKFSDCPYHKEK